MVLTALLGALGFLSRLPVGRNDRAWRAFRSTPIVFPLVGYVLGPLVALPLILSEPAPTVALLFVGGVYVATGINHVDGVADLGDAMVVHGEAADRRRVMKDTAVGTGGVLTVAFVVLGLGTAGLAISALPTKAVLLVVVAEVGAKLGMGILVCLGSAAHEGLGSALTANARPRSVVPAVLAASPSILLTWPRLLSGLAALLVAIVVALLSLRWARRYLDGVSGDVFGAVNELARVAALHAGVIVWTQF